MDRNTRTARLLAELEAIRNGLQRLGTEATGMVESPAHLEASLAQIQNDLGELKVRIRGVALPAPDRDEKGADDPTVIPESRMRELAFARTEAEDLAAEGNVEGGRRCLVDGRNAAMKAVDQEASWTASLLLHWQQALEGFEDRWAAPGS